jgi:hypothetical protein
MKTSTPPSYDKIFQIYVGSTATVTQYPTTVNSVTPVTDAMLVPLHRGLFVTTSAPVTVDFYNLDHKVAANKQSETSVSKSTLTIPANTVIVLPLQIAYYKVTSGSGSLYLYGLL